MHVSFSFALFLEMIFFDYAFLKLFITLNEVIVFPKNEYLSLNAYLALYISLADT